MKSNNKNMRVALVTGVTGQDGSYLAEFLLEKGYIVHGTKRRGSSWNTARIDHLIDNPILDGKFILHYADMSDYASVFKVIANVRPDEIYNLAAQSHVMTSFDLPEYTSDVTGLGLLRVLEAVRACGMADHCRIYQAGTSELFGDTAETPQNENTPFNPQSPYAIAKQLAHSLAINYRQSYNMFVSNGILFNHESPRRGETFVTRKITISLGRFLRQQAGPIQLGNLDAKRDWGHAREFVEAQWLILQHEKADDFVISTGRQISVREFVNLACKKVGLTLKWNDVGEEEFATVESVENSALNDLSLVDQTIVQVNKKYLRPSEVPTLLGDSAKARTLIGWSPRVNLSTLIDEMLIEDAPEFIKP
ncbi:GDP-mannose 4,6-dehydratase [Alphaproteobacteria bacterium]|nr:GDP-mannose 4,6-dehydratase [Alphaproteobacteria bacterium]